MVKAANASGVWSEEVNSVNVSIAKPWWLTVWAWMGYLVMFGLTVFGVDRYQRERLLRKEREAAEMREAQLRAEAAELKSQAVESEARALRAENERKETELQKAAQLKEGTYLQVPCIYYQYLAIFQYI